MRNFVANARDLTHAAVGEILRHLTAAGVTVPDTAAPTCPVGRRPHPATYGRLCRHHFENLGKLLHDIQSEAERLAFDDEDPEQWPTAAPSIADHWNYASGGNTGGGDPAFEQAPALLDPIVLSDRRHGTGWAEEDDDAHAGGNTGSVFAALSKYANRIRAERGLTTPLHIQVVRRHARTPIHGPVHALPCTHESCHAIAGWRVVPALTIATERRLLTRQLEWAASQDWAGDFYTDMARLLDQLRHATGTKHRQPPAGRCPLPVDGKQECGGPLWPVKPKHTVGEWTGSSPSAIQCQACKARWEGPGPLALLAIETDKQKQKKGKPA